MVAVSSIADAGSAERPRVLLAGDHPGMLALTADALAGECLVVGLVADGSELLAEAERLHPDVMCSTLPCRAWTASKRHANSGARGDLPASSFSRSTKIPTTPRAALGAAMSSRRASPSDLLPAIRAALADRRFVSPTVRLDEARPSSPDFPEKSNANI
jgi:DNA-binding NarL/FixJ family response regulator